MKAPASFPSMLRAFAFCGRSKPLPSPAPPAAPPSSPTAAAEQSHHQEQQDRAQSCVDDGADHSRTQMETELRQDPVANECTDNPDEQIADDSEPGPSDDFASQPAGNDADEQYDQQALVRHVHRSSRHLVWTHAWLALSR